MYVHHDRGEGGIVRVRREPDWEKLWPVLDGLCEAVHDEDRERVRQIIGGIKRRDMPSMLFLASAALAVSPLFKPDAPPPMMTGGYL